MSRSLRSRIRWVASSTKGRSKGAEGVGLLCVVVAMAAPKVVADSLVSALAMLAQVELTKLMSCVTPARSAHDGLPWAWAEHRIGDAARSGWIDEVACVGRGPYRPVLPP